MLFCLTGGDRPYESSIHTSLCLFVVYSVQCVVSCISKSIHATGLQLLHNISRKFDSVSWTPWVWMHMTVVKSSELCLIDVVLCVVVFNLVDMFVFIFFWVRPKTIFLLQQWSYLILFLPLRLWSRESSKLLRAFSTWRFCVSLKNIHLIQ